MPFVARTLSPETSSIIETIADNPNSARRFFPSFVFVEWLSKFFKSPLQLAKTRSFRVRGVGWRGEGKGEGEKEGGTLLHHFCVHVCLRTFDGRRFVSFLRFCIRRRNWLFNWLFIEKIFYIVIKSVS